MPSRGMRRDAEDSRAERLESHIRHNESAERAFVNRGSLPQCGLCKRVFEEKSRYCPFCDKKTMGLIKPIPERFREEALRGAIRRARQRAGL